MKDTELIGKKELEWIKQYIENASPTGNEKSGQKMWLDHLAPYIDDRLICNYGGVAGIIGPGKKFKVVIEAHADEIAWYVNKIDKDGFIHVQETGGTDPGIAPSQKVQIHTGKGAVDAIFGWPAIHARETSDDAPKMSSIFLDCGCSSKEDAEDLGIQVGDLVTYTAGFFVMQDKYFVGRALDNRMGGFIIARVAKLLKENNIQLPYTLYIANSVQEEIGTKGAEMLSSIIKPDCAIVVDVTHDTGTPMIDKNKEGDVGIGKGPVILKAPPIHNIMRQLLVKTAKDRDIQFQLAVMAKQTGTDADAFAYQNGGTPTALISVPLRYMHTTVETMHKKDVEDAIMLLYHTLQAIDPEMNFTYYEG
ncbi:MAG TPA: M20/M25/M40 family metallo-hydrolase [Flavipsychrobacter sp.]|nr:M20/M25/M40 family metallo-hydrolase [Flavipsychrobacter sp.]